MGTTTMPTETLWLVPEPKNPRDVAPEVRLIVEDVELHGSKGRLFIVVSDNKVAPRTRDVDKWDSVYGQAMPIVISRVPLKNSSALPALKYICADGRRLILKGDQINALLNRLSRCSRGVSVVVPRQQRRTTVTLSQLMGKK